MIILVLLVERWQNEARDPKGVGECSKAHGQFDLTNLRDNC